MKKSILKILCLTIVISSLFAFIGCGDKSPSGPLAPFIIRRADIPDAYVGYEYDLMDTIVVEENTEYTAEVYTKNGNDKNQLVVNNMKFTSMEKDVYLYAVITAKKNNITELSEEIRIRSVQAIDGFTLKKNELLDAYNGVEYNISNLIIQKANVNYSAVAYYYSQDNVKIDIPVTDMKLLPTFENIYFYIQITATDGTYQTTSEPLRIRCYPKYMSSSILKDFIVEEQYRAEVYYQEEFDLNSLIYKQNGVSYSAKAYYLSGNEKEDIEVIDMKIIPTKLYQPFYVEFTAEKEDETYFATPVMVNTTARVDKEDDFISYLTASSGLKKNVVKDSDALKQGNTYLSMNYSGTNCNNYKTIATISGDYLKYCSITSWDNAVLTFWVQNNEDFDLEFNISLKHNQVSTTGVYEIVGAKEFKKVAFSLKTMGLTSELYYNPNYYYGKDSSLKALVDTITVMVRKPSGSDTGAYSFNFDGLNIIEYDKNEFPNLDVPAPLAQNEIAFVNNKADLVNYKAGGEKNIVNWASEDELDSISGDYNGNAVKYIIKQEYTHFAIQPRITEDEWDNAVNNGFRKMYIWLAGRATVGTSTLNIRQDGSQLLKEGEGFNLTENQWRKVTFDLTEENKNIVFSSNGAKIFIGYVWGRTTVDGNWAYTAYIGDFGFDESTKVVPAKENEIAFVNDETSLSYFTYTVGQNSNLATKTLASSADLEKLSGDYTGNAVKITAQTDYSRYFITPKITQTEWDSAVSNGYTNFYVWVAVENTGDSLNLQLKSENSIAFSAFNITNCVWYKLTFSLNDTNKVFVFADSGFKLFCAYRWGGTSFALYIGDCGFDENSKVAPIKEGEIVYVSEETGLDNYSLNQGQTSKTLATTNELDALGGDYTGNAVKFIISTQYAKVTMLPRITETEWNKAVADGYTKLYYYVATDKTTIQLKTGTNFLHETNKVLTQNAWTKFEIELTEEVKTKLFADGGIILYEAYNWGGSGHALYIGDCGFSK